MKGTMRTTKSTLISEVLRNTTRKTTIKTKTILCAAFAAMLALATVVTTGALIGCEKKGDAISGAEQADKKAGVAAPGIEETKAIAQEGFIYGLPLVMNYAVMNEFAVDTKSSQYKAPFNEINNQHRVATYEDTAVITPNSDTPYSMCWLDLRAEPMVISVPAVEKERYYSVQLIDGNTYNYGYIGSRATGNDPGDYLVVGPGWKGEMPAGIKKVFSSTTPFALTLFRTQLFNPGDMPNVEKVQAGYKRSRSPRSSSNPRRRPCQRSISFRLPPRESRKTSTSISTLPSSSSTIVGRQGGPHQTRQHWYRTGQNFRLQRPFS
jgi:hypothetical protein